MPKIMLNLMLTLWTLVFWLLPADIAGAHHVLGRPAYSLNEDSNTPPSIQGENQIGDYLVTYMVFPAFPRPGEPGRINFYATRLDDGTPLEGKVTFKVRNDFWLSWLGIGNDVETLGVQPPDDNVYRQGYRFGDAGNYIVSAEFRADGEPYVVEFPLRIGAPSRFGPLGIAVGVALIALVAVSVIQRRRSMTGRLRSTHDETGTP